MKLVEFDIDPRCGMPLYLMMCTNDLRLYFSRPTSPSKLQEYRRILSSYTKLHNRHEYIMDCGLELVEVGFEDAMEL